jgi:hypothetical protein
MTATDISPSKLSYPYDFTFSYAPYSSTGHVPYGGRIIFTTNSEIDLSSSQVISVSWVTRFESSYSGYNVEPWIDAGISLADPTNGGNNPIEMTRRCY